MEESWGSWMRSEQTKKRDYAWPRCVVTLFGHRLASWSHLCCGKRIAKVRGFSRDKERTMRLTSRDIEMVQLVGQGVALTGEQLQIGAGHSLASRGRCKLRIALLVRHHYL